MRACGCCSVTQGGRTSWGCTVSDHRRPLPSEDHASRCGLCCRASLPMIQPTSLHAAMEIPVTAKLHMYSRPYGSCRERCSHLAAVGIPAAVRPDYSRLPFVFGRFGHMGRLRLKTISRFWWRKRRCPLLEDHRGGMGFQSGRGSLSTARTRAGCTLAGAAGAAHRMRFPSGRSFVMCPRRSTVDGAPLKRLKAAPFFMS